MLIKILLLHMARRLFFEKLYICEYKDLSPTNDSIELQTKRDRL